MGFLTYLPEALGVMREFIDRQVAILEHKR
jgi:hypothetical protein